MFNIHAYGVRAKIFIEQYQQQLKENKKGKRYNPPDKTLLTKAEDDLKETFEFYSTPMHLELMAEVLYYMATDSNGRVKQGCEGEEKLLQTLTMCAKAAACQDGEKRAPVHKVRGQSLCALGEHQAALRSFQQAVECETTSNFYINSGNVLVSEYEHVLMARTDALPCNSLVFADMVYWLHRVAQISLSTDWVMYQVTKLQDQVPHHWKEFVKYCKENNYMRELHDIRRAAMLDSQPKRYHSFSTEVEEPHIPPVSDQYQLSRAVVEATTSKGDNPHARVEKDKEEIPSEDHNPHARIEKDKEAKPSEDFESATASLSTGDIDGAEADSHFIQITYRVNRKTGKTQHIDIIPSSQNWTHGDVSSKSIRAAPKTSKNGQLTYDFFVIYSDSASEWVFRRLLEELEGSGLKGCIKDRDFIPGKSKLHNYTNSFTNSACTIIVLTTDFEADNWCYNGMVQAIELNKLVIPVKRQPRNIPMFLNTLVPLDATAAVDWERLKRSIEQQIKLDAS